MAVLIIYFPVASAFFDGLMRTPPGWLDLGRTMGASPARFLWRIRVPSAIPSLASGLRLAAVYAPIGAVIGEWVGAAGGLGYLMLLANGWVKIDLMFATLLVLAVLTLILHRAVGWACDRLEARLHQGWQARTVHRVIHRFIPLAPRFSGDLPQRSGVFRGGMPGMR